MIRAVLITSLQEMSRRITALVFILLLPLAFYLVRIDVHWQAIRFLSVGIGWAWRPCRCSPSLLRATWIGDWWWRVPRPRPSSPDGLRPCSPSGWAWP